MTIGTKPYAEYRDAGLPSLSQVPAHWEVRRQRNAVQLIVSNVDKNTVDGEIPVSLCNCADVYKNADITEDMNFMRATATVE